MQEHELTAWLGGTEVTPEQRAALHRANDMIEARWPDPDLADDRLAAFNAATQVILGDSTLPEVSAEWRLAVTAERDAMAALTGAIIAASGEVLSEPRLAQLAGVTRTTVRKALGKPR